MTGRGRLLTVLAGRTPDCVPVCPDMSNMIPCRLTGKPFWDIYLYNDPPLWEAYIHAVKHFDFDGWLPSVPVEFECDRQGADGRPVWRQAIVARPDAVAATGLVAATVAFAIRSSAAWAYFSSPGPKPSVGMPATPIV